MIPPSIPTLLSSPSIPVSQEVNWSLNRLISQGGASDFLPPLSAFWSYHTTTPVSKLQRNIMDLIDTRMAEDLLNSSSDLADKARIVACRVKRSGTWLTVFPASYDLTLLDTHYALAFRLRLGLPPQDDLPLTCKCGTLLAPDPNHFLSCKLFRRTIITTRHDLILHSLVTFIRATSAAVYVEPKFFGQNEGGGRLRPDAQVFLPSETSTLDVSITHPSSPSYALQGSKSPLALAKLRESFKHSKYDGQAISERAKFYPFVMETFGGFGKEALAFIKKISILHSEHSSVQVHRNACSSRIIRTLSILLQRGNARAQMVGAQTAREAAGLLCGY